MIVMQKANHCGSRPSLNTVSNYKAFSFKYVNLSGRIMASFGTLEEQTRGELHFHGILWNAWFPVSELQTLRTEDTRSISPSVENDETSLSLTQLIDTQFIRMKKKMDEIRKMKQTLIDRQKDYEQNSEFIDRLQQHERWKNYDVLMEKYLRKLGHESFRPYQKQIISNVIRRKNVYLTMATEMRKSLCFQIASLVWNDIHNVSDRRNAAIGIVMSPLIEVIELVLFCTGIGPVPGSALYRDRQRCNCTCIKKYKCSCTRRSIHQQRCNGWHYKGRQFKQLDHCFLCTTKHVNAFSLENDFTMNRVDDRSGQQIEIERHCCCSMEFRSKLHNKVQFIGIDFDASSSCLLMIFAKQNFTFKTLKINTNESNSNRDAVAQSRCSIPVYRDWSTLINVLQSRYAAVFGFYRDWSTSINVLQSRYAAAFGFYRDWSTLINVLQSRCEQSR